MFNVGQYVVPPANLSLFSWLKTQRHSFLSFTMLAESIRLCCAPRFKNNPLLGRKQFVLDVIHPGMANVGQPGDREMEYICSLDTVHLAWHLRLYNIGIYILISASIWSHICTYIHWAPENDCANLKQHVHMCELISLTWEWWNQLKQLPPAAPSWGLQEGSRRKDPKHVTRSGESWERAKNTNPVLSLSLVLWFCDVIS